jgi:hypothetical protein
MLAPAVLATLLCILYQPPPSNHHTSQSYLAYVYKFHNIHECFQESSYTEQPLLRNLLGSLGLPLHTRTMYLSFTSFLA